MRIDLGFDHNILNSIVGGVSALDIPRLNTSSLEAAQKFIFSYGFDLQNDVDRHTLWQYHSKAVALIRDELLVEGEEIPELLTDPRQLKDLSYLLIYASTVEKDKNPLQKWSCAILRVMHVFVHLESDLFTYFTSEIQDQILKPLESVIFRDPSGGIYLGSPTEEDSIRLEKFEVKPFKTSRSSVIKLLAKPQAVALNLLDKLGVRIVTPHLFDSFRAIRFLADHSLISFPQIMPDQSNNTLYPPNLFMEVMEKLKGEQKLYSPTEIDAILSKTLEEASQRAEFLEKPNNYSSKEYQFIKFISRKLISVKLPLGDQNRTIRFFFPYEVQISDHETYVRNLTGPASHSEYKKRQRQAARRRVFGLGKAP